MNISPSLSVVASSHHLWIQVTGRGNFQNSTDLKEWIQPMIEKEDHDYIIDLFYCEQMDSTFMGTLAGISQRLRAKKQGSLRVTNVNEANRELMEGLGLDQLFSIQLLVLGREHPPVADISVIEELSLIPASDKKTLTEKTVLSAHEALVALDQKNEKKFKNILDVMRARLGRRS